MKYAVTTLTAVALLIGGRVLEDRWQGEFRAVPVRLDLIAHDLDGWHGTDQQLQGLQAKWAQLGDGANPGYIDREYVHAATGRRLAVLLVWGRPDPVSEHTPDQCYPSAGFAPAADKVRESVDAEPPRPAADFYVQDFTKSGPDATRLRIYWAWNADGHWQAPDEPHEALGRHRQFYTYGGGVLFKLYVIREVSGDNDAADAETCREFLGVFLPEFRRHLFPGT
jgi:hypothetical protein